MRKKILLFSDLLVLFTLLIIACIFLYPRVFYSRSFESLTGLKISDYDKIILFNGDNGKKVEITDKAQIKKILSDFYDIKLRARFFRDKRVGNYFYVGLYKGKDQIVSVANEKASIRDGKETSDNTTLYQLKTPVPLEKVHSIYKEYGLE